MVPLVAALALAVPAGASAVDASAVGALAVGTSSGDASAVTLFGVTSTSDATAGVPAGDSRSETLSTWRILLLVFRQTDTDYVDAAGATRHVSAALPQQDADALVAAFRSSLPAAVREWSNGQAAWEVEVQYPSQAVTRLSAADSSHRQWLDPALIQETMGQYFRPGYHDVVMVYWRDRDEAGNTVPSWGWGLASLRSDPDFGYVTVTWPGSTIWNAAVADMRTQVWIHEWLHTVCFFYEALGYRLPAGGPDGATTHGYFAEQPPFPGWGTYYSVLMNERVLEGGVMTGIPPAAWARGTIRGTTTEPTVDTTGPVTAGKAAKGRNGTRIRLSYRISDDSSARATGVRIVIRNGRGKTVRSFSPGIKATGVWYSAWWRPRIRGSFRYAVYAADLAGNKQSRVGGGRITVW